MLAHEQATTLWACCPDEFLELESSARAIYAEAVRLGYVAESPAIVVEDPGHAAFERYQDKQSHGPGSMFHFERLVELLLEK